MKNRLLSLFTVLAMVLTMIPTTAFAAGSSYDGSYEEGTMSLEDQFLDFRDNYVDTGATVSNDADAIPDNIIGSSAIPFYIGNSATLVELAELIGTDETYASYAYADAYYVMVADIDLGDTEWTAISDFDGTFDGATYSITSSVIEVDVAAGDKVGLFAADTTGVSNVTINYTGGTTGGESTGTTDVWNGSVATVFAESNQISSADELKLFANQVNDGTITSGTYTLTTNIDLNDIEWTPIGTSDKTPFTGTFDGDGYTISGLTITDSSTLSGLFGYVGEGGTVKNVHVEGDVSGTSNNVGGVVGYTYSGTVSNCSFSGSVSGTSNNVGGVVGYTYSGTVSNCYNTGNVSGSSQVGGVVGNDNGGTVSNCVALCQTVTASTSDGGRVVGTSSGNLTNNYAWSGMTVTVASATKTITAGTSEIDGASLTWSDTALSGITTSLDYWNDTSTLPNGDALPVYIIGAYIVSTQADLEAVADDLTGNYILVNDIKLTGEWTPIGDYSSSNSNIFTGTFDGDGYTISGLSINQSSSDYQGLFGYNTGTIKNLNVAGEVTGSQRVGGVVGYNKGTVEYCSSSVTVKSSDKYIGGVVGDNTNGTVQYCYNTGSVTGGDNTGGVVGWNNGTSSATVSNCYNIGTVEGTSNVGGVVGYNQSSNSKTATVEYCYNTGDVKGTSSIGGVVGYNNAVSGTATVSNCVALCATVTGPIGSTGRVVGEDSGTLEYNYALSTMKIGTSGSEAVVEENDTTTIATGTNGATVTYDATTGFSTSWDTMGFSTSDWTIPTSALYLPSLGLDGEALVSFATLEDATSNILTVTF